MKLLKFEIKPGQEIVETFQKEVQALGIKNGAIVSIIGAVDECVFSTMPKDNAQENRRHSFKQPLELSGNGEITEGVVHLHCVFAAEDGKALAGHLLLGKVSSWFVHIFVITSD